MTKKYQFKLVKVAGAAALWLFAFGLAVSSKADPPKTPKNTKSEDSQLEGKNLKCPKGASLVENFVEDERFGKLRMFACADEAGVPSGPYIVYYGIRPGEINPRKKTQGEYKNHQNVGVRLQWYYSGRRMSKQNYNSDGKLNGESIFWFDNGLHKEVVHYKDGALHGSREIWWPNGQRKFTGNYYEGLGDGTFSEWNEEGFLEAKSKHMGTEVVIEQRSPTINDSIQTKLIELMGKPDRSPDSLPTMPDGKNEDIR